MDSQGFYRDPQPELDQGDILPDIPHIHMKPPLHVLRKANTKQGPAYLYSDYDAGTFNKEGELVAAQCNVTHAMVLSYGCDIDNDRKHRLVALIRPLDPRIPPAAQENIRNNGNLNFMYLPSNPGVLPESYVDFRRITTVFPELFDPAARITALSEDSVRELQLRLFMFLTRREIDVAAIEQLTKVKPPNDDD